MLGAPRLNMLPFPRLRGRGGQEGAAPPLPPLLPAPPPPEGLPEPIREKPSNEEVQMLPGARGTPQPGPEASPGVEVWSRPPSPPRPSPSPCAQVEDPLCFRDQTYWPMRQVPRCHLGHRTSPELESGPPCFPAELCVAVRSPGMRTARRRARQLGGPPTTVPREQLIKQ